MMLSQVERIYQTLIKISVHPASFDAELYLVQAAQRALATADVKRMWEALVDIGMRQGFYTGERKIIELAQAELKRLLFQLNMLDESDKRSKGDRG